MKPVDTLTDAELVAEYVEAAKRERWTQTPAGELVGVGQSTASEWWRGVYREIHPDTRVALEGAVRQVREGVRLRDQVRAPEGDRNAHLARQIDAVNSSADPGWIKAWRVAEIAAAYRARALDREADAAGIRAAAVHLAEENAHTRWVSSDPERETAMQGDAAFGPRRRGGGGGRPKKTPKRKRPPRSDGTEQPDRSED